MNLPDGRPLVASDDVLPEPTSVDGRVVFWLRGERSGGLQYWERIGSPVGARLGEAQGIRSVAVTSAPARQRVGVPLWGFLSRRAPRRDDRDCALPDGRSAQWCGPRQSDRALAWSEREAVPLDEASVRARWPECREVRRIGRDLYLVTGVTPERAQVVAAREPDPTRAESSREAAERALAAARAAGDRPRELTALTDLGLALLLENDGPRAEAVLAEARAGARVAGDRAREADALSSLALAALAQNRPDRAREYLSPVLTYARGDSDPYAEKLALERLGLACRALGEHARALGCFERAIAIARQLGDARHEATLLWHAGIQHAELRQPRRAVARARVAVNLFRRLGMPQANWYARHVARYRAGAQAASGSGEANATTSPFGSSIDTSVIAPESAATNTGYPAAGPGVLRMALTATQAMAKFVGSGFRTASPEVYRARLAACAACEHYTGLRCRVCGCVTAAKARPRHEDCPTGRWTS